MTLTASLLRAQLTLAADRWSLHKHDCRHCRRAGTTTDLCRDGQRIHGTMQGHRAALATHENGGRPVLTRVGAA